MHVYEKVYTVEEFEHLLSQPDNQERLLELIHGRVHEKVPTELHGLLASLLAHFLWDCIFNHQIQGIVGVEVRHGLSQDKRNSRLPDVSFRFGTRDDAVKRGAVLQMPIIAAEIQSPDDTSDSLIEKATYYLQNGSALVWLFFVETQTVGVCTLDEDGEFQMQILTAADTLTGGTVLPEFKLALEKLFPKSAD